MAEQLIAIRYELERSDENYTRLAKNIDQAHQYFREKRNESEVQLNKRIDSLNTQLEAQEKAINHLYAELARREGQIAFFKWLAAAGGSGGGLALLSQFLGN